MGGLKILGRIKDYADVNQAISLMPMKEYAPVKDAIDRSFAMYALYMQRGRGYEEWADGRLTGMLYVAVMSDAITVYEYEYVNSARNAIALDSRKF